MNWGQELVDLYEKNSDKIGIIEYRGKMPYVLLPPFHTTVTAQIEVTIDENGNFLNAFTVEQEDKLTIIPITEKSGSRTAGKEPHPLCDNLRYLAGDYSNYCEDDGICYNLYIEQLKEWYQSEFCHRKVQAVYLYLTKKTLVHDLVDAKILKLNEDGGLDEKQTIQGIPQTKALVRFVIRSMDDGSMDECWRDRSLQECYIKYTRSQVKQSELCYLSGNMEPVSYLHSKKIRNEGDGAKLISSNDSQNFTYRGRFANKEEAFAIGSETSQKIHNALKWIIRKQGTFFDSLTIVTWESNRLAMPKWEASAGEIVSDYELELPAWDDEKEEFVSDGNKITADQFSRALNGYGKNINNTSSMIMLGVDAATPGRLSLVEEKTLDSARYLSNIRKWHESCEWIHERTKDGKQVFFYGMVGVKDIADLLFGVENNGILTILDANGKKLYAEVAKDFIPCIWDGQRVPYIYVLKAIEQASSPQKYKNTKNWERVLTLACSLVKRYEKDRKNKEEWKVALDRKENDRSYLYGRLLAVADRIEYRTYDEGDKSRITNAKRYMSTFAQRPFDTWKVIEENIQPYMEKIKKMNLEEWKKYENLLDEIFHLFEKDTFKDDSKLDGLYLLGFHSQSYELRVYKQNKSEEE